MITPIEDTPADSLIRELGDVLVAAHAGRLDAYMVAAIDRAILETTRVVGAAIRDPGQVGVSREVEGLDRAQALNDFEAHGSVPLNSEIQQHENLVWKPWMP